MPRLFESRPNPEHHCDHVYHGEAKIGEASFRNSVQAKMFREMVAAGTSPTRAAMESGTIYLPDARPDAVLGECL